MKRLPIPLSKGNSQIGDGDTRLYQYWTFEKLSARHWFARWVWLGIRNRAGRAAAESGAYVPDLPKNPIDVYGYTNPDGTEKITIRNYGDSWQIQRTRIYGPFHVRCNLGYKLDCINRIDRLAPVVWVPFAVKIRFNKKFDI
jgi:hypothetical protein